MNRLIVALMAGVFAVATSSVLADDKTPTPPVDQAKLKAEREAAKAKWAKMTPEEKAATRKAANAKKRADMTELEKMAQEGGDVFDAKQGAKDAAASKAGPSPAKGTLNTPEANKELQKQKGQ
jgi:cell division protein FtsL